MMQRNESSPVASEGPVSPSGWRNHRVRAGTHQWEGDSPLDEEQIKTGRKHIEPWLAALFQAEHLNLLVGSGLTSAVAALANVKTPGMGLRSFDGELAEAIQIAVQETAKRCGRGEPNFEDQIRAENQLIEGLRILASAGGDLQDKAKRHLTSLGKAVDEQLFELLKGILGTERNLATVLDAAGEQANKVRRYLGSFLLSFASRTATRERLHIFTTNYDRVLELGCDLLGLRVLDRFVGRLKPVFRASRLGIDMHYNPPGIRGEPRYLEGVVRFTKLHGSVDWRQEGGPGESHIVRIPLPFGAEDTHPGIPKNLRDSLLIYPNPAKDVETLEYPYAELFRDFAAAVCQPNAVLVTYGYGFGDDHINRILRDMLTIPSSHLAIISYDGASGRIERFVQAVGRDEQVTVLLGNHFGDLAALVDNYLPKPAIDRTTWRMVNLLNRRTPHAGADSQAKPEESDTGGAE